MPMLEWNVAMLVVNRGHPKPILVHCDFEGAWALTQSLFRNSKITNLQQRHVEQTMMRVIWDVDSYAMSKVNMSQARVQWMHVGNVEQLRRTFQEYLVSMAAHWVDISEWSITWIHMHKCTGAMDMDGMCL